VYISPGSKHCLKAVRGVPEDDNRVNSKILSEAAIERVSRCNWRLRLSGLRDALGGRDRANLEIHLQGMIEQDWWSTFGGG